MAIRSEFLSTTIVDRLTEACREALDEIVLAPSVEIREIEVDPLRSARFDSETATSSYVVTINTNDATMLRGAVAAYKGSYKERIEAVLNRIVKELDPEGTAHVNIEGPETTTVDRLIPISSFIQRKRLSPNAPIVRTAKRNGIDYIQIRGRHLIAPSPAIAEFLEEYVVRNAGRIQRAADLFAGTAIATKVLLRTASPDKIVLIENDPQKVRRIRQHINDARVEILETDVMGFSFIDKYDLVVADPYYEDVQFFLDRQIENLRRNVGTLVLVPGNIEDRVWNSAVRNKLESLDYSVLTHERYGQVIFEAKLGKRAD